ncbi:Hypothetical predicted protein [Olea europaea subsp. europaea]|uniref:Short-chain dehydrogenase TIC 32, chloroplastic n=1 Tax=Olea europaea subsp. europaea TaxID=158383 RepID=A0A8S0PY54_OLEEU|nr:Hypothetical predicted protein [Olea europaea subsp. europaea]
MKAANEAKQLILKDNKTARLDALKLDLASLKSVKAFANNFIALKLPLNILINNAGIMFCPYQLSEDGIEMQFATNHLGHFYLTNLLLDIMKETARSSGIEGRIINLTSVAHLHTYDEGIQFDKMNEETSYLDKKAYGQSKLANILHANELSRRLQVRSTSSFIITLLHFCAKFRFKSYNVMQAEGANITVNSVHPGLITTNLYRHSSLFIKILKFLTYILWKSIHQVNHHDVSVSPPHNISARITFAEPLVATLFTFLCKFGYSGGSHNLLCRTSPGVERCIGKIFPRLQRV